MANTDYSMIAEKYMSASARGAANSIRSKYDLPLYEEGGAERPDLVVPSFETSASDTVVGPSNPLDNIIDEGVASINSVLVDESFGSNAKKGWEETETWIGDGISYKFAKHGPAGMKQLIHPSHPVRYLLSDTLIEVLDKVTGDDVLYQQVRGMSEDERREYLKAEKQKVFTEMHGWVGGNTGAQFVGSLTKEVVADPTTLVGGTSLKALVKVGAGLGALNSTFEGLAEEGKVDATDVAIGAVFGAAGGVGAKVLMVAGESGLKVIRNAVDSRIGVGKKDLDRLGEETGTVFTQVDDEMAASIAAGDVAAPKGVVYTKRDLEEFNSLITLRSSTGDTVTVADTTGGDGGFKNVKVNELEATTTVGDVYEVELTTKASKDKLRARLNNDLAGEKKADAVLKKAAANEAEVSKKGPGKPSEPLSPETDTNTAARLKESEIASQKVEEVVVDLNTGSVRPEVKEALGLNPDEPITVADAFEMLSNGTFKGTDSVLDPSLPTVGKDINFVDAEASWPLLSKVIGNGIISNIYARPAAKLQAMGTAGRRFAERLGIRREKIAQRIGSFDSDFLNTVNKHGYNKLNRGGKKLFTDEVKAVMRRKLNKGQVSQGAWETANLLRKHFKRVLGEASRSRVIDGKRFAALTKNFNENGYWPRIINFEYLNSNKGKEHFINEISNHSFSKAAAEKVARSLVGDKWRKLQGISKQKDGTYRINREVSEQLLTVQRGKMNDIKSNHLENDRTLDLPDDVLDPFLVQEMEAVLTSYNKDTFSKIVTNDVFGINGTNAARDILDIRKATGDEKSAMFAAKIYYNAIGHRNGPAIEHLANMGHAAKVGQSYASSYQTLKLLTAQISNLTSATVLLPTKLSKSSPDMITGMRAAKKGMQAAMTAEGWDVARKMGAISDNLVIQMQAEMGSAEKKFVSGYLKWTGFTATEEFNRVLAAHTGKALVTDIYEQLGELAAKQASKQKIGKSSIKRIAKLEKTLKELGLPTNKNLVQSADIDRAAQRFSNSVNFTTGADQLPMTLQSPYARLFRQFQSYSLFYGAFLKDNVFVPLSKGNPIPLATLVLTASSMGSMVYDIKEGVGGVIGEGLQEIARTGQGYSPSMTDIDQVVRDTWVIMQDKTLIDRAYEGLKMAGGFGLFGNYAEASMGGRPGQVATTFLGPTFSDVMKILAGIGKSFADLDSEAAEKALLSTLPKGRSIVEEIYTNSPDQDRIERMYKKLNK